MAVLRGDSRELPSGLLSELPGPLARLRGSLTLDDPMFRQALRLAVAVGLAGLIAALLDLSRIYWAVFAAVVVLNAPPARDLPRAMMRIGGTVLGFMLAIGLVALVGIRSWASPSPPPAATRASGDHAAEAVREQRRAGS